MNVTRRSRNIENHGHGPYDRSAYQPIISHSRRLVGSSPHELPFHLPSNASMLERRGMRMVRRQTSPKGRILEPSNLNLELEHSIFGSIKRINHCLTMYPRRTSRPVSLAFGVRISLRAFTPIIKYNHTVYVDVQYPSCSFTIVITKTL
jgi:hypothetical protein